MILEGDDDDIWSLSRSLGRDNEGGKYWSVVPSRFLPLYKRLLQLLLVDFKREAIQGLSDPK